MWSCYARRDVGTITDQMAPDSPAMGKRVFYDFKIYHQLIMLYLVHQGHMPGLHQWYWPPLIPGILVTNGCNCQATCTNVNK